MSRARAWAVALALVSSAACAPRLMKLPSGAGQPAPDARAAFDQATAACSKVQSLTAEVAAGGSVAGQGLRGRLLVGLAEPGSVRLEAVAPFGQPIFILVGRGDEATLLLPRDERVLQRGKTEEVIEAVAGVPLDGAGLRVTLAGCSDVRDNGSALAFGQNWRVVGDGTTEVYVRREKPASPWQLAAVLHRTPGRPVWRAEYREFQNGLPRSVRLASSDRQRFDLRLGLSQVEVNTTLGPEVFAIEIPPGTQPMTIDELRHARPGFREN